MGKSPYVSESSIDVIGDAFGRVLIFLIRYGVGAIKYEVLSAEAHIAVDTIGNYLDPDSDRADVRTMKGALNFLREIYMGNEVMGPEKLFYITGVILCTYVKKTRSSELY